MAVLSIVASLKTLAIHLLMVLVLVMLLVMLRQQMMPGRMLQRGSFALEEKVIVVVLTDGSSSCAFISCTPWAHRTSIRQSLRRWLLGTRWTMCQVEFA